MYFNRGSLPWQGLKAQSKNDKYRQIMEKKVSVPAEVLCRQFPSEFVTYLNYCRSLRFEDRPDYGYLRRLLKDLFFREGFQYDFVFDWTILNYQSRQQEEEARRMQAEELQDEESEVIRMLPRATTMVT
mmetsp:Transcript_3530/g.5874  ORF Transcript_3530/g.5874 Transcript_3530/m.5874 type:complete len:129 (-) Transcript_3530:10-396(-)